MENANTTSGMAPSGKGKKVIGIALGVLILVAAMAWFFGKDMLGEQASDIEVLSTSTRAAIIADEKPEIISGLLKTKEEFSSKDASRIREYAMRFATEEEKEQFDALTDEELLNGASLVSQLYVHATEESLLATSTVWEVVSRKDVRVGIYVPAENRYAVVQVNKVDGEWY